MKQGVGVVKVGEGLACKGASKLAPRRPQGSQECHCRVPQRCNCHLCRGEMGAQ